MNERVMLDGHERRHHPPHLIHALRRVDVASAPADATVGKVVGLMASGHSHYPVLGSGVDDVVGVICLRDVLALEGPDKDGRSLDGVRVADVARQLVLVPASLSLPAVLTRLREAGEELACVIDEYGGLAGVITLEDIAEELVGEITDEHDPAAVEPMVGDGAWIVPGMLHINEVERLIDHDLPIGDYQTIGGLVVNALQRLPAPGDAVTVALPAPSTDEEDAASRRLVVTVRPVQRRMPSIVRLAWAHEAQEVAR